MFSTEDTSQLERPWLKDVALWNIPAILVTLDGTQPLKSPLKEAAARNILSMSSTEDTSQLERPWLKDVALWNIPAILVTLDVFQPLKSPLKEDAPAKTSSMYCTEDTSQPLISALKLVALRNILAMDVTPFRLGASVGRLFRLEAVMNASSIDCQVISPHCST